MEPAALAANRLNDIPCLQLPDSLGLHLRPFAYIHLPEIINTFGNMRLFCAKVDGFVLRPQHVYFRVVRNGAPCFELPDPCGLHSRPFAYAHL